MHRFDEDALLAQLSALPAPLRVVFAAACAERLIPAYSRFRLRHGVGRQLEQALEELWLDPGSHAHSNIGSAEVEQMEAFVPQEDGFVGTWTQQITNAQNAGMATIYALRARLGGDPHEATWAARVAYEALDNFVINRMDIDVNEPDAEARVLAHPLVQAEIARQLADLQELGQATSDTQAAAIDRVRARATIDAARFFGT